VVAAGIAGKFAKKGPASQIIFVATEDRTYSQFAVAWAILYRRFHHGARRHLASPTTRAHPRGKPSGRSVFLETNPVLVFSKRGVNKNLMKTHHHVSWQAASCGGQRPSGAGSGYLWRLTMWFQVLVLATATAIFAVEVRWLMRC
jgi:hypothetical protein